MLVSEDSDRGGVNSKMLRIALAVFGVGVLLLVAGAIAFTLYRDSKDRPIDVERYPGAELVQEESGQEEDHLYYLSGDTPEAVEAFYQDEYDDLSCERQYQVVQGTQGSAAQREGYLYTRCWIDHSWLDMTQYAVITIFPERDDADNPTGKTVIDIRRVWGG